MRYRPSGCSEFPNDNPQIHDGAVWVCSWTRARPRALLRAKGHGSRPLPASGADAVSPEPTERTPTVEDVSIEQLSADQRQAPETPPQPEPPCDAAETVLAAPRLPSDLSADAAGSAREEDPFIGELEQGLERTPIPAPTLTDEDASPFLGAVHDAVVCLQELLPADPVDDVLGNGPHATREQATSAAEVQYDTGAVADDPFLQELAAEVQPEQTAQSLDADDALDDPFLAELSAEAGLVSAGSTTRSDKAASTNEVETAETSGGPKDFETLSAAPSPVDFIEQLKALTGPPPDAPDVDDDGPLRPLYVDNLLDEPKVEPEEPVEPPRASPEPVAPLELEGLSTLRADGGWQEVVSAVARFLLQRGHTRAAALLPSLLEGRAINVSRLPARVVECLVAAEIAHDTGAGVIVDDHFRIRARRMHRACIDGRLDPPTLGDWLTPIVRALIATPNSEEGVFEELRQAGIAAVIDRVA